MKQNNTLHAELTGVFFARTQQLFFYKTTFYIRHVSYVLTEIAIIISVYLNMIFIVRRPSVPRKAW